MALTSQHLQSSVKNENKKSNENTVKDIGLAKTYD